MDIQQPLTLLAGMSPAQFMRRHWHKKPLLVRQAFKDFIPPVNRSELVELAAREDVESRLVEYKANTWHLRHGPFTRRMLPPFKTPQWTLLVQGVDLHDEAAHALLQQFSFVPQARMDDLMISYASDGGGVGPHCDNYDVFLLQAEGKRIWRIGQPRKEKNNSDTQDGALHPGLPLKILQDFVPEEEYVLEPGDMLYLPPNWAHDGVARGECMTCSIGFRTPLRATLAQEMLLRLADVMAQEENSLVYRDTRQLAVSDSAAIPAALQTFARKAVRHALADSLVLARTLGETLTEPKANVVFQPNFHNAMKGSLKKGYAVVLDRRTRMLYDQRHVYINGESWRADGHDAELMRRLANQRRLEAAEIARGSEIALDLLLTWYEAGWLHPRV